MKGEQSIDLTVCLPEPQQSLCESLRGWFLCDDVHPHSALPFNVHHRRRPDSRDFAKPAFLSDFPTYWKEGQVFSQDPQRKFCRRGSKEHDTPLCRICGDNRGQSSSIPFKQSQNCHSPRGWWFWKSSSTPVEKLGDPRVA